MRNIAAKRAINKESSEVQSTTLSSLRQDAKNARRHNSRNLGMIETSLRQVGAARSGVIDENGVILAGNGTYEALARAGIEKVKVVEADGNEWVVVKRSGLSEEQKRLLALADNRSAELAEWDPEVLAIQGIDLDPWFTSQELRKIGAGPADVGADGPDPQLDKAEALREHYGVELGQIWQLGEHRLACGDSTSSEQVSRLLDGGKPFLMVTDPPYGVEYDPEWREKALPGGERRLGEVENDERIDWTEAYAAFPGYVAYVWHAGRHASELVLNLRSANFEIRTQIIWRKQHFAISRGHYHWQHEPCWYAVRRGHSSKWCGDHTQSTIWDIASACAFGGQKDDADTNHGTQKPLECMARPIRNHGGKDDDVYDPFLGSGTTLIACEQLGRRCYAMEISPAYVAVAIQRWVDLTGKKPKLL